MYRAQFLRVATLAVVITVSTTCLAAPVGDVSEPTAIDTAIREQLNVAEFDLIDLDLPADAGETTVTPVTLGGVEYQVILDRHSLRSPDFQVLVPLADGTQHAVTPPPVRTYQGTLAERHDSRVAATLDGGQLTALILLEDGLWGVQPLTDIDEDADPATHVVYQGQDLLPIDGVCGTDLLPPLDLDDPADEADDPDGGFDLRGTGCDQIAEIAFDADYEFFQRNGSSVGATVQDIETVLNGVEVIYNRDVDIVYELTTVIVRDSEPDPYSSTDASTLLDQFRSEWRSHQTAVRRDIAHFMTGKNISGSTIGIAWVGVICSTNMGYGLSQSRFTTQLASRVGLTSHEVGHNWNASHCDGDSDCRIMCSGLGGCAGSVTSFGTRSKNAISSFRDGRSCLSQDGASIVSQPTPLQEVCAGDSVSLSIVADATFPEYQWRIGTIDLVDDGVHVFGATTSTLLLVDVTGAYDADNYRCDVTDALTGCSATSDRAEIRVDTEVPIITGQPSDQTASSGGFISFSVTVVDPFLTTFQWRKDGTLLVDGGRLIGTTTGTLFITAVEPGDAGDYDCEMTSVLGSGCVVTSNPATLTVEPGGADCPEDLDGDGDVDLADLAQLLANYGTTSGAGPDDGDIDSDGDVDLSDLAALLAVYGAPCS